MTGSQFESGNNKQGMLGESNRHGSQLHLSPLLFLEAVLPTIGELLQHSPKARKILGFRDIVYRITANGMAGKYYHFHSGQLTLPEKPQQPHVHLHFPSPLDLQKLLLAEVPSIPHIEFPQNFSPHLLPILPRLLIDLDNHLRPPENEKSLLTHLHLLLSIAFRALPHLARHDPPTQAILAQTPPGLLSLLIPNTTISAWAGWDGQHLTTSTNTPPPRQPDAQTTFQDPLTAYHTFNESLDTHAAIGLQRLQVKGHLPLADQFSLLLERLPHFLPQG